jgi:hypothetical protein
MIQVCCCDCGAKVAARMLQSYTGRRASEESHGRSLRGSASVIGPWLHISFCNVERRVYECFTMNTEYRISKHVCRLRWNVAPSISRMEYRKSKKLPTHASLAIGGTEPSLLLSPFSRSVFSPPPACGFLAVPGPPPLRFTKNAEAKAMTPHGMPIEYTADNVCAYAVRTPGRRSYRSERLYISKGFGVKTAYVITHIRNDCPNSVCGRQHYHSNLRT